MMGTSPTAGDGTLIYIYPIKIDSITDGTSHTLIMGERGIPNDLYYGWPYCGYGDGTGNGDNLCSTEFGPLLSGPPTEPTTFFHFWSYHPNMANFSLADGSVRPLFFDIDFTVFQALSTRAGGETVEVP